MALQTPSTLGVVHSPIEYSESIRPAGKYRAAPWLPVKVFDNHMQDYIVMYSGIPVAGAVPVEAAGRAAGFTDIFPAALIEAAGAGVVITYAAADVAAGVIDVTTGILCVAAATVSSDQLRTALLLPAFGARTDYPIGVLSYNAFRFPGGDGSNPNGFAFTNFGVQDQIAITCDYVLEVPVAAGVQTEVTLTAAGAVAATNPVAMTLTGIVTTSGSYTVTVNGVDQTADVDDGGGAGAITAADVTFATVNIALGDVIVVNYITTPASATMLTGTPLFVTAGTGTLADVGVYVKSGTTEGTFVPMANGESLSLALGQIISIDRTLNRGALDKVRTQYQSGTLNTTRLGLNQALYSQPGSATGGKPGNLYRAMGTDFNGVVRINLLK